MKKIYNAILMASVVIFVFSACTKDVNEPALNEEIPATVMAQIKSLGFSTQGVKKVAEGYLVEGDIILSDIDLCYVPTDPNLLIAKEEQYRTFKLVSPTEHPTIKVRLSNSSSAHQSVFSAALDEAIARYNAQNLRIKFQRVSSGGNITVVAYYEVSNVLGSAGFPDADGDPYSQIKMNTYHYSTSTGTTNKNYIATIMAHEMGHCIGFRHTDYMNRAYSCGSGGNEGQTTTGVGAVHIPGTPTGPDAASWMLACIGSGVNRPFNTNDKTALAYVY